ncbi:MAG: AI-2E family transporter YdiK [Myxococcales bacterium]
MSTTPHSAPNHELTRITLCVLGIGILIAGSLRVLEPFLVSILWATTIVVSTWSLMLAAQARLGGRRGAAVAVMTVVLLLVLFVPLYLAVSTLLEQRSHIKELARDFSTHGLPAPPVWLDSIPVVGHKLSERWLALAMLDPTQLTERVAPYLRNAISWFAAQAGSFGSMVLSFLLTVAISAILYAKGETTARGLIRFFHRLAGDRGDEIVILAGKAIKAVALGIVVTAAVQTALAGIGLFVAQVPFAGVLTAIVLVLCIAQVGPLLAMLPCVIWLYTTGAPGRGTLLLVFMIVAIVIDNILRPLLIRRGVELSLLLILPGVIGGLLWLGIIGLFVGPVVLAVTSTLIDSWISTGLAEAPSEPTAEMEPILPAEVKITPSP